MTDFPLMSKMSIVCKRDWLVSLCFNVLVKYERAVGVNFERFLKETLLLLWLGVYFKILVAWSLFFEIEFVRGSVAGL